MVGPSSTVLEGLLRVRILIKIPACVGFVETEGPTSWN